MNCFSMRLVLVVLLAAVCSVQSYTPMHNKGGARQHHPSRGDRWTMYAPSKSPSSTSSTQPMIAQKMLKTIGHEQEKKRPKTHLSQSVLASCDTLPCFSTAHGILSPETVSKMDEMTQGGLRNEAVSSFLSTYRKKGPMACLPMLSDPEVLPHLTQALRDITL